MSTPPINLKYIEDFQAAFEIGCENPNCNHKHDEQDALICHSKCHPNSPVDACFWRHRDCVSLICRECGGIITEVAIASKEQASTE